jgi:hypothetical protein
MFKQNATTSPIFIFIFMLLFCSIVGCTEKKPTIYKEADQKEVVIKNKWLSKDENFDTEIYKKKI